MSTSKVDFQDIESVLKEEIGEEGLAFLLPQIRITKKARNLPKDLIDEKLIAAKFLLAINIIEDWLAPMAELFSAFEIDELNLHNLQQQARFALEQSKISSWQEAMNNQELSLLFKKIQTSRIRLEKEREQVFKIARRYKISELLGLILYPYSGHKTLLDSIAFGEKEYYGPNVLYRKTNKYTDAIVIMKAAQEVYERKDLTIDPTSEQEIVSYEKLLNDQDSDVQHVSEIYMEAKKDNFTKKGFNMRDVNILLSKVVKRGSGLTPSERSTLNTDFYVPELDSYRCDLVMEWVENQLKEDTGPVETKISLQTQLEEELKDRAAKRYLFGLSFLDKHVYNEILGNIAESSFVLMEKVLSPFIELKQNIINMDSAQFEINHMGLPDQAWIYDFTGIKTEILRSTMLLISERQPKFDLLEQCQSLVNAVLSGRVDRNDQRKDNNYIYTNLLPKETWDFVGKTLMQILKEALIDEDVRARYIVRKIFAEEDRSHLVSSKQFLPVFYIELQWELPEYDPKKDKQALFPTAQTISIWKAKNFDFQYRHCQAAGYPWYFIENNILRELVKDSLKVSQIAFEEVQLKRVIYSIDQKKFIVYFQTSSDLKTMQVLAFKEAEEFAEGLSPVEVLFRPKKYIDKTPLENNLHLLIKEANARDTKDLETLISSIDQKVGGIN
ncbi:MAG: hypothetical protein ACFFD1_02140 [Candidatus Thorarchaeota archaeon]